VSDPATERISDNPRASGIPVTAIAAIIVATVMAGVGGFLFGRSRAADRDDAAQTRTVAERRARQQAEQAAKRRGFSEGRAKGLVEGRKDGTNRGSEKGKEDGAAERERRSSVVLDCPATGAEPNISHLSVRNMSCQDAVTVIQRFGTIEKNFSAGGFDCSRLSGVALGGTWRCTQGETAFRFDFGD
jgi:hypothetical protein